ncbi:hypothetical protein [Escherichia sp. E4694]|uniref:hypothetical protein n=1 Tax=Escherichia sp. E4694 TaxID=2044464 RepID=UPI001F0FA435|nr:hypothetical protein [Escherichia sp. E4694]
MSILNEAIKLYKNGEYHKSLLLFEKASEIYDASWVKANIILCKKALQDLGDVHTISAQKKYRVGPCNTDHVFKF